MQVSPARERYLESLRPEDAPFVLIQSEPVRPGCCARVIAERIPGTGAFRYTVEESGHDALGDTHWLAVREIREDDPKPSPIDAAFRAALIRLRENQDSNPF